MSLAMGVPMVINDLDFDVEDLTLDDFPDEAHDAAVYMISQVELSKTGWLCIFCRIFVFD